MKRLNLVSCVRKALEIRKISTVQVVQAVNSALGDLEKVKSTSKTGYGSTQAKKGTYKVSESQSHQYAGELNMPLQFDVWHGFIERADKAAEIEVAIPIPSVFDEWLDKMVLKSGATVDQGALAATPEAPSK